MNIRLKRELDERFDLLMKEIKETKVQIFDKEFYLSKKSRILIHIFQEDYIWVDQIIGRTIRFILNNGTFVHQWYRKSYFCRRVEEVLPDFFGFEDEEWYCQYCKSLVCWKNETKK